MQHRPLLIAGWSTRAAVQSAARGGFAVAAIDAFQDADLLLAAERCLRVTNLRQLATVAKELPPSDWLYTGGVENHPSVLAAMATRHHLLGNGAAVLKRVRDPRVLQRELADGPAPLPETRWTEPERGDERRWLVKRRSSGGGIHVQPYKAGRSLPRGVYLQEFFPGMPCGASYLAADGRCRFLGLCRQTTAAVDPARPFLYGGSIGPLPLEPMTVAALAELGDRLAAEFELTGLFGVDVILRPDGSLRTLEVNPRYTASMELLERAAGRSLVDGHVKACRERRLAAPPPPATVMHGKRIVYVDESVPSIISPRLADALMANAGGPDGLVLGDLPTAGTRPRRGDPLCSLFATGANFEDVERGLNEQSQRLRELLRADSYATGGSVSSRTAPRRRRETSSGS